jgi:hypothetical protein
MTQTPTIPTTDELISYLPQRFSPIQQAQAIELVDHIKSRISWSTAMAISYRGTPRIIVPASLYLQSSTQWGTTQIRDTQRWYPHERIVRSPWARRAIWLDALEIQWSMTWSGWKSFHIDRIDDLRLLTLVEIERIWRDTGISMIWESPAPIDGFVKNWDYWFRQIIIEREGRVDLRIPGNT